MDTLPSFVALGSGNPTKIMALVTEGNQKGCLEVSESADVFSTKAKFAVEYAGPGRVHLKCCYNNKYLTRAFFSNVYIGALADETEGNSSKWKCTLFDVELSHDNDGAPLVALTHVHSKWPVFHRDNKVQFIDSSDRLYFKVIDYGSLVKLPKRVTFKGDNGKYLRGGWQEYHQYNMFICDDNSDPSAQYEIFTANNGDIRVKAMHFGKFWRRSPNWIWGDSDDTTTNDPDTMFEVVKLGDNVIALRNRGNNRFCKRLTTEGKESCLNAAESSVIPGAKLVVDEPVESRTIECQFRLDKARIYGKEPLQAASVTVPNRTDRDHEIQQGFTYTKVKTSTWSTTTTIKAGVKANVKSGIPFLFEGKVEVSGEISEAIQFGQSFNFSQQVTSTYKVPVPAKTIAIVKLLATRANYDVPFSYVQTDRLKTGEKVVTKLHDGVYKGVETYDFHYDAKCEPL